MTAPTAPGWVRAVASPLIRGWLRLDVEGADEVPATGPVIVAPVHRSYADIPAVGAATNRPLTFLGSAHLGEMPVVGWVLPRLGLVQVERGTADIVAMERCLELLADGGALVIFPEGGRSRDPSRVHAPRSGVGRLAAIARCPVVPVGLSGTEDVWPAEAWPRLRRGTVRVRFGAALDPPANDPGSRREFGAALHAALIQLSGAGSGAGLMPRALSA